MGAISEEGIHLALEVLHLNGLHGKDFSSLKRLGSFTSQRGAASVCAGRRCPPVFVELVAGRLFLQLAELRKEGFGVKEQIPEHKAQPVAERTRQAREARQPACVPRPRPPHSLRGLEGARGTAVCVQEQLGSMPGSPRLHRPHELILSRVQGGATTPVLPPGT